MRVSRGEVLARRGALCHATSLHLSKWFLHHLPEPIRLLKASSKSYHAPAIQLLPLCQIGSIRVIEHQRTSAFPVLLHPSQANAFTRLCRELPSILSSSFERLPLVAMTEPVPAAEVVPSKMVPAEVVEGWNDKQMLQWIKNLKPGLLKGEDPKTLEGLGLWGFVFLDHAGDTKFFQSCGLTYLASASLATLARRVLGNSKFIL